MARRMLDENLPVIKSDTEEGNIPNIIIDERYGIEIKDDPVVYSCVERKISRSLSEDGTHVIQYYKWTPFPAYCGNLDQALKSIIRKSTALKLKDMKKLELQVAVDAIVDAEHEFSKKIDAVLSDRTFKQLSAIEKQYKNLELKLKGINELENKLTSEADKLMAIIKEKRKIIVER